MQPWLRNYVKNSKSFPEGSTEPQIVTLKLTPDKDLEPGNYMLTLGARYGTVTYSIMLDLNIK